MLFQFVEDGTDGGGAVSYTHLDVYTRQLLNPQMAFKVKETSYEDY